VSLRFGGGGWAVQYNRSGVNSILHVHKVGILFNEKDLFK
jgi:hypothetical protein